MKNNLFEEKELPSSELEKLGLYDEQGRLMLDPYDKAALLAGRRTDMISLTHLSMGDFWIEQLDVKLSLDRRSDERVSVNLHPINKQAVEHPLLDAKESAGLIKGELSGLLKTLSIDGNDYPRVVEYDRDTREFITYNPKQVTIPEFINGEKLTGLQKQAFRTGQIVELSDGVKLQHRASERKGVVSDTKALILSVLIDGGISYFGASWFKGSSW